VELCQDLSYLLEVPVRYLLSPNRLCAESDNRSIRACESGSYSNLLLTWLMCVQVRRQLEYSIAASKGVSLVRPPSTMEAVREILRNYGVGGLYLGFRLHFRLSDLSFPRVLLPDLNFLVRDTTGTALYFLEYDGLRHLLGRQRSGEQGPTPPWLPIHSSIVPFVCGSLAGVSTTLLLCLPCQLVDL